MLVFKQRVMQFSVIIIPASTFSECAKVSKRCVPFKTDIHKKLSPIRWRD